jgi:hypothetical protein
MTHDSEIAVGNQVLGEEKTTPQFNQNSATDLQKPKKINGKKIPQEVTKDREDSFDRLGEEKLPFHILGFNGQKQILIWHKGKILPTPVRQLTKDDLKLLVGEKPAPEDGEPCPYAKIKGRIINSAYNNGLVDDEDPIRSGIWRFKDDWVIVSGKQAALIQTGKLTYQETPLIADRVIEFERSSWIQLDLLQKTLQTPCLKSTFSKVKKLVSQWCWQDEKDGVVDFIAAFIMLQLFQSAMRWRPWIYLLGAAGTGKSSFFEHVLERLFGCLVKRLDKSTAHATAQSIGGSGKVAIFDEFEKNKHLSDVLELLKLCNRGGRKTSGTTTEKAKEFALHHLPWLASIYLPVTFRSDQAQLSRVVKFELKKVPEGKSIAGIPDAEAQELLCEIIASVIASWSDIESVTTKIEQSKEEYIKACNGKIDGRCVENLMYPMALLSLVDGKDREIPNREIPKWAINEVKDDGANVLEAIIFSKIRYMQDEYLVIDLINTVLGNTVGIDMQAATAKDMLRKNGLSVVQKKENGWFLAVLSKEISETLLKTRNEYRGLDIRSPLERLEGVQKSVKTDWGNKIKCWALHVPVKHITQITGLSDE